MEGTFVVKKQNVVFTYYKYEDIPEDFDHLISFKPNLIPGPHTHEEHEEIESWGNKLNRLMEIERRNASSHKNR